MAEIQEWIKKENFAVLQKEYEAISENVKLLAAQEKRTGFRKAPIVEERALMADKPRQEQNRIDLGKKRCGKIVEILKQRKTVQVKDLKDVFPTVSKRTLRRDFEYLLQKGIVERLGDNNTTLYQLTNR